MKEEMTVRELKIVLSQFKDDDAIMLSSDAEGNGFAPLDTFGVEKHLEKAGAKILYLYPKHC